MCGLTGDDPLWNWARWTWSGATMGNMVAYVSWEDDPGPILRDHAQVVEAMHAALPWHERMVIIAEFPQKNAKFGGLDPTGRRKTARAWIAKPTWACSAAKSKGGWLEGRARGNGLNGARTRWQLQDAFAGAACHLRLDA